MPRQRNKANRSMPSGCRWKNGAWRYMVPKTQRHLFDGKTEITLAKSKPQALIVYAGRVASLDDAVQSFNQLIDRYLYEVTPTKAQSTQIEEARHLSKLRTMIGENPVSAWQPHHAYRLRDTIFKSTQKGSGETYTNRVMEKLKHLLTKAIEWGVIAEHPMTESKFKMLPTPKKSQISRAVSIEQVLEMLEKCPAKWLVCYVKLKLMTALRQVDLLLLTVRNITPEGILVTPHKTENSTGKTILFEWDDGGELRAVINQIRAIPPTSIYFFTTTQGKLFFENGTRTAAFKSAWARWMVKFPKEQRFSERSIRNLVLSEDDFDKAFKRSGNAIPSTTAKFYRLKPVLATPLTLSDSS